MTNSFFYYALGSTVCLSLFLIVYSLMISNLTHFSWMRIYLLTSLGLSLVLPLIILPIHWRTSIIYLSYFNNFNFNNYQYSETENLSNGLISQKNGTELMHNIIIVVISVYITGLLYKSFNLIRNLISIQNTIKNNPKVRDGRFWIVELIDKVPPFSFFNYIFLTGSCKGISQDDLAQIKEHEKVHAIQMHSLDVLFIEFISVIFWFNPLMTYLKKSIQQLHEYIVDEMVAGTGSMKKGYAELLMRLASEVKVFNLSAGFTGKQIKHRIEMLAKPRSLPHYKLRFAMLIPLTIILMLSFSYIKNPNPIPAQINKNENYIQGPLKIGKITWKGNKVYDIKTLNQVFGLAEGSPYNKAIIDDRLNGTLGAQDAVSNLYLDNGYLFNRIVTEEIQNNDKVDLTITINEGKLVKFNDVTVKVNGIITTDLDNEIKIYKGDLFSKAKIILAVRALGASGKFDPAKINPKPFPISTSEEFDKVDIIFELTEISNSK